MSAGKLPIVAAVLVRTSRASIGIGVGASLVLWIYIGASLIGQPLRDSGLFGAASAVLIAAGAIWVLCGLIALIADRMRGL